MPRLSYLLEGQGPLIVLLHGWGQNKESMMPLAKSLVNNYQCLCIDLPGFGDSKEIDNVNSIKDYSIILKELFDKLNLKPLIMIGHSFGGKIAIDYQLRYNELANLIIISSPLVKPNRTLKYYFRIFKYKILKRLNLLHNKKYGSNDYQNASLPLRKVLVSSVNTHYNNKLKDIKIPTLIVWGKDDLVTPLKMGKKIHKKITNSKLLVTSGTHFSYLENINIVLLYIQSFIRRNSNV